MATNANTCKYRVKYGWFLFGKYRCEMSLRGKKWTASKAVCNGCDGPMLETTHDCIYFKIGTEKPYTDRNTVVVKGYCFRIYKDEKDFRNEIKDLETCNPNSPKCLPCYQARPIIEKIVRDGKSLLPWVRNSLQKVVQLLPFKTRQPLRKKLAIFSLPLVILLPMIILILITIIYAPYNANNKHHLPETPKSENTQESLPSLPSNKPNVAKNHKDGEKTKKKTLPPKSAQISITKPDGKHPQDSKSGSKKEETSIKQDMIRASLEAGRGHYNNGEYEKAIKEFKWALEKDSNNEEAKNYLAQIEKQKKKREDIREYIETGNGYFKDKKYDRAMESFNKVLEIDPGNREARDAMTYIAEQKQKIRDYLGAGNVLLKKGLYDKAIENFKKVSEIDPNNEEALEGIKKSNEKSSIQVKNIAEPKTMDELTTDLTHGKKVFVDPTHGRKVFVANCVVCHGEKGNGKGPASAAMNPKPTDFTDSAVMRRIDDARLKRSIKEGRPGTAMVGFRKTLNDKDIENVIGYIKGFLNK